MKNLLYALILALSIFLTACTSMNGTQKVTSSESINTPSNNTSDEQEISKSTYQKDSLKESDDSYFSNLFSNNNNKDCKNKYSNNSSERAVASKHIDNALELCGEAQKSLEKGATGKALQYFDAAYSSIVKIQTHDARINKQKDDLLFMISKRKREIHESRQASAKVSSKKISLINNEYVQNEIDRFTGPQRDFFIRAMARGAEYRPFIVNELKKAGMPEELAWLPLIESGFRVRALSPASALGLWQFIPSTGYRFGLNRDYYVDERMDPFKSTKAAIQYLSQLHKMFGDWSTALAAYNCGEGRVLRTIRSQNVNYLDNFWDLYEKLPRETATYVPRFIATVHIIKNLEKYGMPKQKNIHPIEYETVRVNKQVNLTDIARTMSISRTVLETLNPELKYGVLPPEEYQLRIPSNKKEIFLASIDDIKQSESVSPKTYSFHKVKTGETLFSIAKTYGIPMGDLAGSNNISRKSNISAGQMLKIPPSGASSVEYASNSNITNKTNKAKEYLATKKIEKEQKSSYKNTALKYRVKQGDTMWAIAQKYNTTPDAIKNANSLSNYTVKPNKDIIIPQSAVASASNKQGFVTTKETKSLHTKNSIASNNSTKSKKSTHWVKSGDTLFTIAQKYNMSVQTLFDLNKLPKGSKIFPGQKLLVK